MREVHITPAMHRLQVTALTAASHVQDRMCRNVGPAYLHELWVLIENA